MNIPHSKPYLDERDIQSVLKALKEGHLATGKIVNDFISELCNYVGRKYGIATNSGSSALHLALRALNIKESDEIILPSYVCGTVLNPIEYCRATPVFVDINKEDFNISYEETKKKINNKTKVIIIPHMFGDPVKDIEQFQRLNIPIIEDCALSFGAQHNGKKIGSFGEISIFSFYSTKMIASGFGGMVLTDDNKILGKLKDLTHYDNREEWGESYNYSMSDLQAALGLSQLRKLDEMVEKRKKIALKFNDNFLDLNGFLRSKENIFFRYIIQVTKRDEFIKKLKELGISSAKPVFKPLHRYKNLKDEDFSNTTNAYEKNVSIPIYPSLTQEEIDYIIESYKIIHDFFGQSE